MTRILILFSLLALLAPGSLLFGALDDSADDVALWDFDVFLNDKKVGKHQFSVSDVDGMKQVRSKASFKYKILLITAYRYEHTSAERWSGDCLVEFDASTNANGKRIQVSGERSESGFVVSKDESPVEPSDCVMTFAYWNSEFLDQARLLNPQTGEFMDVEVELVGDDVLDVRGRQVLADRFRVTATNLDLTLWYSSSKEWLALESVAKGGHIIRYELS